MRHLFAETFLVPLLDPEQPEPQLTYDEGRDVNVLADGTAYIETAPVAPTQTITEVRAEADDFDRPDEDVVAWSGTDTKVRTETDDFARPPMLATETRQAPGERDDVSRAERLFDTETAIGGEADDFARGADLASDHEAAARA
jgi:hypothetical protein